MAFDFKGDRTDLKNGHSTVYFTMLKCFVKLPKTEVDVKDIVRTSSSSHEFANIWRYFSAFMQKKEKGKHKLHCAAKENKLVFHGKQSVVVGFLVEREHLTCRSLQLQYSCYVDQKTFKNCKGRLELLALADLYTALWTIKW